MAATPTAPIVATSSATVEMINATSKPASSPRIAFASLMAHPALTLGACGPSAQMLSEQLVILQMIGRRQVDQPPIDLEVLVNKNVAEAGHPSESPHQ